MSDLSALLAEHAGCCVRRGMVRNLAAALQEFIDAEQAPHRPVTTVSIACACGWNRSGLKTNEETWEHIHQANSIPDHLVGAEEKESRA